MLTSANWSKGGTYVTQTAVAGGQQFDVTAAMGNQTVFTYQSAAIACVDTDKLAGSFEVTVPAGFPAVQLFTSAQGYISGASTGGNANGASITINPGETKTIPSAVLMPAAGTNGYRSILRAWATIAAGARIIVHNSLVEKDGTLGTYFDGTTAAVGDLTYAWTGTADASTSTESLTTYEFNPVTPLLTLGYSSSAQSLNVTHQVLGGDLDVTVRAAGMRTGTLQFLFSDEDDAAACELMHRQPMSFTLTDDDRATIDMTYVIAPAGNIARALDGDTRDQWTVSVDFQEVAA